ncbi:MAG: ParB/RepB/Spo0J family partition protein [Deltaproteobacteria bacterium]|nr:ParB/RepB/Spo0J family partition protein [Deltaproteobacteria bacterium]
MLNSRETTKKRNALGLGLDALISVNPTETSDLSGIKTKLLRVDSIQPNPNQPRQSFNDQNLIELASSISEIGLIQPIIVRVIDSGSYEIVAGERRWRAAILAKKDYLPAIIRNVTEKESIEIALIENLQREDLNPLETAEAYETLIEKFSYTHEILANRIGKDRTDITNHLRLLRLPEVIKNRVRNCEISMGHARTLLAIDHIETQLSLSEKIIRRKLSVRELEQIVQNYKKKHEILEKNHRPESGYKTEDLEKALSRHFSTKIIIRKNNSGSGRLEFHFHSLEELLRLLDAVGFSEELA